MVIRAYDEIYLANAQNILGHAVDFAVLSLEIDTAKFEKASYSNQIIRPRLKSAI